MHQHVQLGCVDSAQTAQHVHHHFANERSAAVVVAWLQAPALALQITFLQLMLCDLGNATDRTAASSIGKQ